MALAKDLVKKQLFKADNQSDDTDTEDPDPAKWLPEKEEEVSFRDNIHEIVDDLRQGMSPTVTTALEPAQNCAKPEGLEGLGFEVGNEDDIRKQPPGEIEQCSKIQFMIKVIAKT